MCTLIGDSLIAAAFLTYCGQLNQELRELLMIKWKSHIQSTIIPMRIDLSISEYLSTVNDRMIWIKMELPTDFLCIENAIILNHHDRYPLIIDPSNQVSSCLLTLISSLKAFKFMKLFYADKRLVITSFLDNVRLHYL